MTVTAATRNVGWGPAVDQATPACRVPWMLLAVVSLAPGLLAVVQLGRIHPDEIFQFLEPALRFARGYGLVTWSGRKAFETGRFPWDSAH